MHKVQCIKKSQGQPRPNKTSKENKYEQTGNHQQNRRTETVGSIDGRSKNEAEALRDAIKAEMYEMDTEELVTGTYIVRWTSVLSNRFDTTAFKKVMPDVYKAYTKQVESRRFTIA